MLTDIDRRFGEVIGRLVRRENLTKAEARAAFELVLADKTTEMQQGAFLAALAAKGETAAEAAGAWEAIYLRDTNKVDFDDAWETVENSGTGMDTFKTFNISTAASVLAASAGVRMARHGARAITSACGTVDMAESLGVDVDCEVALVADSIRESRIGLFNGMSPKVHPKALGRILSRIAFGSTLNIAASLANPASPTRAVRGVFSPAMLRPVADVMLAIGYRKALVLHGHIDDSAKGMDEASVCGATRAIEITERGELLDVVFRPEDFGLRLHKPEELAPRQDMVGEARAFVGLMRGEGSRARRDATILNAGLIHYVAGRDESIAKGIARARRHLEAGDGYAALEAWVAAQNVNPDKGLERLKSLG